MLPTPWLRGICSYYLCLQLMTQNIYAAKSWVCGICSYFLCLQLKTQNIYAANPPECVAYAVTSSAFNWRHRTSILPIPWVCGICSYFLCLQLMTQNINPANPLSVRHMQLLGLPSTKDTEHLRHQPLECVAYVVTSYAFNWRHRTSMLLTPWVCGICSYFLCLQLKTQNIYAAKPLSAWHM